MRKRGKQAVKRSAALLTAALVAAGSFSAFAAEPVTAEVTVVTDTENNYTTEVEIFWSDDWLLNPSTEYNHEFAITSIALSDAAYLTGEDGLPTPAAVEDAFVTFGFDPDTICSFNYDYPYTDEDNDVAAYTFAAKKTEGPCVVAVVVRGTQIGQEWLSNLRVSAYPENAEEAVEHYGFTEAERKLSEDLGAYVSALTAADETYDAGDLSFYVTGHSRGGAIADILAAELDDFGMKDRVTAYTFAAPAVSESAGMAGYENIFNIVSLEDFVPQLPFSAWNFKRYGVDLWIPGTGASEGENDLFYAHNAYVYYARMKSGLPDTLFIQ